MWWRWAGCSARRCACAPPLLALVQAVAFAALTDPWVHGALLVAFVVAGLGLFVMLSWLLARLLGAAPAAGRRAGRYGQRHARRCRRSRRRCERRRSWGDAPAHALSSAQRRPSKPIWKSLRPVRSLAAQQPQRPRRKGHRHAGAALPPGRGCARTPSCPACSAAPRRRGAWSSGWHWRRGSCRRRASTSGRAAVRCPPRCRHRRRSRGRRCCSARSCRSSCRCAWLVRARCERGITRRQPFSVVDASSATHTVQVASGRIGQ